jgi:peptidoglycan/xylan/chitin deacetylase (PgdA/CDA1 family)
MSEKPLDGYAALCYHYIRPARSQDPFPRILGLQAEEFRRHLRLFRQEYRVLTPQEARAFSYGERPLNGDRPGLLLTFDDGLADHYRAAQLLAEQKLQAFFFIPTCILVEQLPANPTIIHFCLARFGLAAFLRAWRHALEAVGLAVDTHDVAYERGDDPWHAIGLIKQRVKYDLGYGPARDVLLRIYRELLLPDFPEALAAMHLTAAQLREMLTMGHAVGVHSHSHISMQAADLSEQEFQHELIQPKQHLEAAFGAPVNALSYPFGSQVDCLSAEDLIRRTNQYELAFTIDPTFNTQHTSPLELGRYMPMSTDAAPTLREILARIVDKGRPRHAARDHHE